MADPTHPSHEEHVLRQRQRALSIATAVLRGTLGPTYGSRLIVRHCRGMLGLSDDAESRLLVAFIGLDKQTAHLPLGAERELRAPEEVRRADAEIARHDALAGADLRAACRQLIDELTPLVPDRVNELDVVETLEEIVDEGYIPEGATGTVVQVHLEPKLAYLVEFCSEDGSTLALQTLLPHQVRVVSKASPR